MFSPSWRRPERVEHPRVWSKFERIVNGQTTKFKVQDLTEDMLEEAITFMSTYYAPDEPWNYSTGIADDPVAMKVFTDYIRKGMYPHNCVLVCLLDQNDTESNKKHRIIGCNLLAVSSKCFKEDFTEFLVSDSIVRLLQLYEAFKMHYPDPYEKYGVDEYLGSIGLAVHPDYRGHKIATEILLARILLCKCCAIPLTAAVFTTSASQRSATLAGFQQDGTASYDQLSRDTGIIFKKHGTSCSHMTFRI